MEAESKNSKFCVKYIPKGTHTQKIRSLPKKMTPYLTDYENVAEPPSPLGCLPLSVRAERSPEVLVGDKGHNART